MARRAACSCTDMAALTDSRSLIAARWARSIAAAIGTVANAVAMMAAACIAENSKHIACGTNTRTKKATVAKTTESRTPSACWQAAARAAARILDGVCMLTPSMLFENGLLSMVSHKNLSKNSHCSEIKGSNKESSCILCSPSGESCGNGVGSELLGFVGTKWELSGNERPLRRVLDEKKPSYLGRASLQTTDLLHIFWRSGRPPCPKSPHFPIRLRMSQAIRPPLGECVFP